MAILIVPGLNGSGPQHWQSYWERSESDARRVEQADWHAPSRGLWSRRLIEAIERNPGAVLVAHSLGCVLVAHVAEQRPDLPIGGAFLVAPADVDSCTGAHAALGAFAPLPLGRLRFPSVVVASTNDPFIALSRATAIAGAWGARFVDVGACGHINVEAGLRAMAGGLGNAATVPDDLAPAPRRERIVANAR